MDALVEFAKNNPLALALFALAAFAWAAVGLFNLLGKLVQVIAKLTTAIAERRKGQMTATAEGPAEPSNIERLIEAMTLLIQSTASREVRIGNLADKVAESNDSIVQQSRSLAQLAESIARLATTISTLNTQNTQSQSQMAELIGRIGHSNQLSEDWQQKAAVSEEISAKAVDSLSENSKRLGELKDQVAKLEKDIQDEVLPLLRGAKEKLDALMASGQSEIGEMEKIGTELAKLREDVKTLIVNRTAGTPVETKTDSPAIPPEPNLAVPPPKEEKPS